jgi:predicted peptidase
MPKGRLKYFIVLCLIFTIPLCMVIIIKPGAISKYLSLKFHPARFKMEKLEYSMVNCDASLKYRIFVPKSIKNPVPLVLYLHGGAERGGDNTKHLGFVITTLTSKRIQRNNPSIVIAPQCPINTQWVNTGFAAIPYDHYQQDEIPESNEMKLIRNLINDLSGKYPVDTNRLYILGFSMGGSGTWDMITRYPDLFAAAVPMSGVSDTSKAYLLKHTKIWAFHGENDEIAPARLNQNMVSSVNSNGGDAKITIIKNGGHGSEISPFIEQALPDWLFDQRKTK